MANIVPTDLHACIGHGLCNTLLYKICTKYIYSPKIMYIREMKTKENSCKLCESNNLFVEQIFCSYNSQKLFVQHLSGIVPDHTMQRPILMESRSISIPGRSSVDSDK